MKEEEVGKKDLPSENNRNLCTHAHKTNDQTQFTTTLNAEEEYKQGKLAAIRKGIKNIVNQNPRNQ